MIVMTTTTPTARRLSGPIYLRLISPMLEGVTVSLREHIPAQPTGSAQQPLVVITLHPGIAAGSYGDRDYFERLAPHLFRLANGRFRLRIFTINHPGYDRPPDEQIDPLQLAPYSIQLQPRALGIALTWLLNDYLQAENSVHLIAYGHSMGGLALSRYDLQRLQRRLKENGRTLTSAKILAAPAFFLSSAASAGISRLDFIDMLKQKLGRLPLYRPAAENIYYAVAPLLFRRGASKYAIDTSDDFYDINQVDPFLLLEQGRELIRFNVLAAGGANLLPGARLIVPQQDNMIDVGKTLTLTRQARQQGHTIDLQMVDSSHVLERDAPAAAAQLIMQTLP